MEVPGGQGSSGVRGSEGARGTRLLSLRPKAGKGFRMLLTLPETPGGQGGSGAKGSGEQGYVILGCRVPTTSVGARDEE